MATGWTAPFGEEFADTSVFAFTVLVHLYPLHNPPPGYVMGIELTTASGWGVA